jgi:hypothetical protein
MASGPSTSATCSWPASTNATTSSADEGAAGAAVGEYPSMGALLIVALRGGARCVITPLGAGRSPNEFQQLLPMFPVFSVTDLPGCSMLVASRYLDSSQ